MKHKPIPALTESDLKRFWDKINVRGPDDCWEWTASGLRGYGQFILGSHGRFISTRVAYFIEHGVDPGDANVCHTCDNPPCCNPAHLWLGTQTDNIQDAVTKDRIVRGERNGQARLTEKDVRSICNSDETQEALGERYGVSRTTISTIKNGKSWKHILGERRNHDNSPKGEQHPQVKLTEQDVREIRESGKTQRFLAEQYGVSQRNISAIKTRRSWKHIK